MKKIPAEVYSRVCGYFRPVHQWNKGKKEEFEERQTANLQKTELPVNDKTPVCS